MRKYVSVWGVVSVLVAVSLQSACEVSLVCEGENCKTKCESGCPAGKTCEEGLCVPVKNPGVCGKGGSSCPAGEVCVDNVCTPAEPTPCTQEENNCPAGEVCVDNVCTPAEPTPCTQEENNCPAGEVCVDNVCTPAEPTPCTQEENNCPAGEVCVDNVCTPAEEAPCAQGGSSCPADEVCVDTVCTPADQAPCALGGNFCAGVGEVCVDSLCEKEQPGDGKPWTSLDFSQEDVEVLRTRRVFFAHKSVGGNLMDGMSAVASELLIHDVQSWHTNFEATIEGLSDKPAFVGYELGSASGAAKVAAFENTMQQTVQTHVDIALMKFCYADLYAADEVDALFATYREAMRRLEARFPGVRFVHVTIPLERDANNAPREAFNALLRETYKADVFDLAKLESIRSDGSSAYLSDGVTPALASEWTDDGGHLNAAGQARFGGALIGFLAQVK